MSRPTDVSPVSPTPPSAASSLSRRDFLTGSSALLLGVALGGCSPGEPRSPAIEKADSLDAPGTLFAPDAFVRVAADGTVTVVSKHFEMGQGPHSGLTTLVAEELDADWSQMRVVDAPADQTRYANLNWNKQGTGGSSAIANAFYQMRNAGAAARQMLVEAAAESWAVPVEEIEVEKGEIRHSMSGRSEGFGAFAAAAATRSVPASPRLKDPSEFVFIGKELPRIDSADKSDGSALFTLDHHREGMLVVVIERPPCFGARVASFDASRAENSPGVVAVREVPEGVAVYAEDTWSALVGRRALSVEWDESDAETRSSQALYAQLREAASKPGLVAAERGTPPATIDAAMDRDDAVVAEAEFAFPFLAHAPMETLCALVELDPDGDGDAVRATYGCQGPGRDHPALAEALGLPLEKVALDVQLGGGSFGRRSQHDAHFPKEAAHVFLAQPDKGAARRPTKLMWTREDDIRGGYYRPMVVHRLRGAMSRDGELLGWDQTIAAQPFRWTDDIDHGVVEGARNLPYQTNHLQVSHQLVRVGVPTLWWRSVGHTHTGFAAEAFIDELLEGAGQDPVAGRLKLLAEHPRHRGVLERAAEMADWGRAPSEGRAFGVAVHESFGSFVAQIVEIEAASKPAPRPRVRRVWCAVDCGIAVNPNVIRAQMEGGIGFGLGAALYSEVHLDDGGRVRESNFDRYQNLRIDDMPEVEVAIVPSAEDPTGVGEPGVPPIAPAVANAWRRLTGERVTQLPFVREA